MTKFFKLMSCFILGHKWEHVRTIKVERKVPNARAVWLEKSYNVWKCNYCNSIVRVPLKKQPNNNKRKRLELISNYFSTIIED